MNLRFEAIIFIYIGKQTIGPRASGCYELAGAGFECCEWEGLRANCIASAKLRCEEILSTI
jgi:hypothetical protein